MKLFILSPKSTEASEKAKRPGDNAVFVVIRYLREAGFTIVGNEVSKLPGGKAIPLKRRAKALVRHRRADITLIMGNDTLTAVKRWFPVSEAVKSPQPFFYINEPGRIQIELIEMLKDYYNRDRSGFNVEENSIGGAL